MSEPLILLPGMMCDARLFAPVIETLPVAASVVPIHESDTMRDLARRVLDAAPERFALGGLSMGGIVAMEVLRQAPGRVARLALMDTNPLAEAPEAAARREPQMRAVRAGRLETVMREEMKPNYLADGPDRRGILDLCMDMARALGPDAFIRQSRALRDRPDQTATLRSFGGPALALCGREDRLCPPARHELMHGLMPHSKLAVIEGAGHLPTLERPRETSAALRRWLEAPLLN